MWAGRWQAEQCIPHCNVSAVDDVAALHYPHAKACEVVFACGVKAWHFRGFATHQRATCFTTRARDASDDAFGHVHLQAPGCVVIQEQQGLSASDQHVVHAHGHQILTDVVVAIEGEGKFQLRADAVGASHQHWLAITGRQR